MVKKPRCEWCGTIIEPTPVGVRGRPRTMCSQRCSQAKWRAKQRAEAGRLPTADELAGFKADLQRADELAQSIGMMG